MINMIRTEIQRALSRHTYFALGEVLSIDWQHQTAICRLSSGARTNPCRISALATNALFPLRKGDEVLICFPDGCPLTGIILCPLFGATPVPPVPEKAFGLVQGSQKVIFDDKGNILCEVQSVDISASGQIKIDAPTVLLAGAQASAVRYEELAIALNTLVTLLASHTHICNAIGKPSGPPVPTPAIELTPARALKTKLT
ncbi:MAG: hypothetical protein N2248_00470 [candidate division WOR-3 bacterium]|nr:hypothetical protein [candidate division WOR-3 bacterium]